MRFRSFLCAMPLALASLIANAPAATAAPDDYEFQLIKTEVQRGDAADVAVKLVDKRTGQPVANAIVFATRMDMQPDGMEAMTTPVEPMPSTEAGIYHFKTNLVMAGGWRFSIAAKVQGEPETITSRLIIKVLE